MSNPSSALRFRSDRVDFPALAIAAGAALISYAVAITLLINIPVPPATAGIAQYLVSGLAPLIAVAIVYVFRVRDRRALGLKGISAKWILIAIGAGVLAVVLSIVVSIVTIVLIGMPSDIQADYQAAAQGGPGLLILTLVAGAVLTPIGEELLFRGVLTNALLRFGPWIAVPVSAAIFALAHGINYVAPVAFVIGIITGLLFAATRSIWPGVIVHAVNNSYSIIADALLAAAS